MVDIPKTDNTVFVIYACASGTITAVLEKGITPIVPVTSTISAQTAMKITSSGFSRKGLEITPVLSSDKKSVTFNIIITACNMYVAGTFSVTVTTAGDEELGLEGTKETIRYQVICYGKDRPMLFSRFDEYNCYDSSLYTMQTVPYCVNTPVTVGVYANNMRTEDSGFTVYNREDKLYYTGSPGKPGLYGLAVLTVTGNSDDNIAGVVPNPFPGGGGAGACIVSIYDGVFQKGNIVPAIPGRLDTLADEEIPDGYRFALHNGDMGANGGLFTPVFKDGKLLRYDRTVVNTIGTNTTETYQYRIIRSSNPESETASASSWYFYTKYFLDNNEANWQRVQSKTVMEVSLPVLVDEKEKTYTGVIITPPFSAWGDAVAYGDSAYFVSGHEFFNSVIIVSKNNEFDPIHLYLNRNDELLIHRITQTFNGTELIFFPELEGWSIISGSDSEDEVEPQRITHTVIPYAPPAKDDLAIDIELRQENEDESFHVPQALGDDLSDLAIACNGTVGGVWRRYPLQRLIQPEQYENLTAHISLSEREKVQNIERNADCANETGYRLGGDGINYCNWQFYDNVHEWRAEKDLSQGGSESYQVDVPMRGVIRNGKGVSMFCGMDDSGSARFNFQPSLSTDITTTSTNAKTVSEQWERISDEYITVTHGGRDYQVLTVYGRSEWVSEFPEEDEDVFPEKVVKREEIIEKQEEKATLSDTTVADCYLTIGQTDVKNSEGEVTRKLAQAVSYNVAVIAEKQIETRKTREVYENDVVTESEILASETSQALYSKNGWGAEAYPRTAAVNAGIGADQEPEVDESLGGESYTINFSLHKQTGYTCYRTERESDCVNLGKGKTVIHWNDGEDHHVAYEHDCYGINGTCEISIIEYAEIIRASASFSYDASTDKATLTMSDSGTYTMTRPYSSTATQSHSFNQEHYDQGYNMPYDTVTERKSSWEIQESNTIGFTESYSDTHTKTTYPAWSYGYDSDDVDIPEPDIPEAETIEPEPYSLSPKEMLRKFEDFVAQFNGYATADFPVPEGEWDYIQQTVSYTEAPVRPNSHNCTLAYSYHSTEDKGLKASVSFSA